MELLVYVNNNNYLIVFAIAIIVSLVYEIVIVKGSRIEARALSYDEKIIKIILALLSLLLIDFIVKNAIHNKKNEVLLLIFLGYFISVYFIYTRFYNKKKWKSKGKYVYAKTKKVEIIYGKSCGYKFYSYITEERGDEIDIYNFECYIIDMRHFYKKDMEIISEKGILPDVKVYVDGRNYMNYYINKSDYFKSVLDYNRELLEK